MAITGKAFLGFEAVQLVVSVSAGAKDKQLGKKELKSLIAKAETKADHERIAQYFDAEATKYDAEAKEHGELAPIYQQSPDPALSKHPNSPRSFAHCDSLSKSLQQAAENARQLAADPGFGGDGENAFHARADGHSRKLRAALSPN